MSAMHIREAGRADAAEIAALHAESWRASYRGAYRDEYLDGDVFRDRLDVWTERLSAPAPNQLVVVAEEEGRILGFACAYGGEDPHWGSFLDNLHVRGEHQRRGIGARLIAAVATWCRANHPDCGLYLWVLEQNKRAQLFYARLGAADRGGEVEVPPGGGQVTGRRYVWSRLADIASPSTE
jgi:GNAT superfamily N-acetyltransferase